MPGSVATAAVGRGLAAAPPRSRLPGAAAGGPARWRQRAARRAEV